MIYININFENMMIILINVIIIHDRALLTLSMARCVLAILCLHNTSRLSHPCNRVLMRIMMIRIMLIVMVMFAQYFQTITPLHKSANGDDDDGDYDQVDNGDDYVEGNLD